MSGLGSYQAETEGRSVESELDRLHRQTMLSWAEEERLLTRCGVGRTGGTGRVLELGCGPGFVTRQLLRWLPDARITAIDIDPGMLVRAAGAIDPGDRQRVGFEPGRSEAIDRPDDHFDFILARYLFQHLPDPSATAREARRLLAPGGWLAVVDVDAELWGVAEPVFREVMPIYAKTGRYQAQRGGNRLIGRRLWRILRAAGFENVELAAFVYHSDAIGLGPFAPQLDPDRLLPAVRAGVITDGEFGTVRDAYERFMDSPDAYVMMIGLMALAQKP